MVKRFVKITIFAAFLAVVWTPVSSAEEAFVKYSEVKDQIADKSKADTLSKDAISQEDLQALQQSGSAFYLFDARSKTEFDREHITGGRLPRPDEYYRQSEMFKQQIVRQAPNAKQALSEGTRSLSHDAVIVTYCNKHCGLSKSMMLDLRELGFANVRWLDGGIDTWREKGYSLEKTG